MASFRNVGDFSLVKYIEINTETVFFLNNVCILLLKYYELQFTLPFLTSTNRYKKNMVIIIFIVGCVYITIRYIYNIFVYNYSSKGKGSFYLFNVFSG